MRSSAQGRSLEWDKLLLLVCLTILLCIAPFYLWHWTIIAIAILILLEFYHKLWIQTATVSGSIETSKKRVKIDEDSNFYIRSVEPAQEKKNPIHENLMSEDSTTSLEFSKRVHDDILVKVAGLRIAGTGCASSGKAEYKLEISTKDGKAWKVWRTYEEIYNMHTVVEHFLESDISRTSLFTRIVPSIPAKRTGIFESIIHSRRSLMNRRWTCLEEFIKRIFGEQSNQHYRKLALKIHLVRSFFELAPIITNGMKKKLKSKRYSPRKGSRLLGFLRRQQVTSGSYYESSDSED